MLLLLFYGLGLGVPFVVAGVALGRALGAVRWLRRHSRAIGVASAVALISFGVIMITGNLSVIASWVTEFFESTPLRGSSTASDTAVPSWSSRSYASGSWMSPRSRRVPRLGAPSPGGPGNRADARRPGDTGQRL